MSELLRYSPSPTARAISNPGRWRVIRELDAVRRPARITAPEAIRYVRQTADLHCTAGLSRDQAIDRIAREHQIDRRKIACNVEL
jgi:hypothetical protein